MGSVVVFDLEATGLSVLDCQTVITDLGAVVLVPADWTDSPPAGGVAHPPTSLRNRIESAPEIYREGEYVSRVTERTFQSLVQCGGVPIPPQVEAITHITNEMIRTAPPYEDVIDRFCDWLDRVAPHPRIFVAHNGFGYDTVVLWRHMEARRFHRMSDLWFDTAKYAKHNMSDTSRLSVSEKTGKPSFTMASVYAALHAGRSIIGAHRALTDALALVEICDSLGMMQMFENLSIAARDGMDVLKAAIRKSEYDPAEKARHDFMPGHTVWWMTNTELRTKLQYRLRALKNKNSVMVPPTKRKVSEIPDASGTKRLRSAASFVQASLTLRGGKLGADPKKIVTSVDSTESKIPRNIHDILNSKSM